MTPSEQIQAVFWYQGKPYFHPMTCGVSSSHEILMPEQRGNSVVLVCETCGYEQEDIPEVVFDLWGMNESIRQEWDPIYEQWGLAPFSGRMISDDDMKKDWTRHARHFPPGTPVYLFRAEGGRKGPKEKATLLTSYMTCSEDNEHPQFRTESGDHLRGCECWWIPVNVADSIEDDFTPPESEDE